MGRKAAAGIAGRSMRKRPAYLAVKRGADVFFSAFFLLLLLLPLGLVALVITAESGRGAIFRQVRLGRDKKPFVLYKFRTMDSEGRATRAGAFLRRSSIDELPQLWNILKGDMSFVGYRPVIPEETYLIALRDELGVYAMRPGLTGLAQINGRDLLGPCEKARFDGTYLSEVSFATDLRIVAKTVGYVLRHQDYREKGSGDPER